MSLGFAVLAALSVKPRTGYELSRKIDSSIAYFWNATHQQIYKELKELTAKGWIRGKEISQSTKPDKKVFRLTTRGLKELKQWIATETELPPAKDALLIKIFAGYLVPPAVLLDVLNQAEAKRRTRLAKYETIVQIHFNDLEKISDTYRFQYLTLRRGILFEKAWLSWAKETRDFLERR